MPQRRLVKKLLKKLLNSELVTYGVYPNNKQLFVVDLFISSTLSIEYVFIDTTLLSIKGSTVQRCKGSLLIVRVRMRMRMNLEPRIA